MKKSTGILISSLWRGPGLRGLLPWLLAPIGAMLLGGANSVYTWRRLRKRQCG